MDDLTRFAQRLVERLGGEGVSRPVSVAALRETVLPYRIHRTALGLASVEDYEAVLLRLIAEEGGYVKTQPSAAAERCRQVLAEPNPDLGVLEEVAESTIQLTSIVAGRIVADEGMAIESIPAAEPPREVSAPSPAPPAPPAAQPEAPTVTTDSCAGCGKTIPAGRPVVFCPWCGRRLIPFTCTRCGTALDSDWRHCITCGSEAKDPHRYP